LQLLKLTTVRRKDFKSCVMVSIEVFKTQSSQSDPETKK